MARFKCFLLTHCNPPNFAQAARLRPAQRAPGAPRRTLFYAAPLSHPTPISRRLRIYALLNAPRAAESHTVLVTDIPGVDFGTQAQRLDKTPLRFLPPGR